MGSLGKPGIPTLLSLIPSLFFNNHHESGRYKYLSHLDIFSSTAGNKSYQPQATIKSCRCKVMSKHGEKEKKRKKTTQKHVLNSHSPKTFRFKLQSSMSFKNVHICSTRKRFNDVFYHSVLRAYIQTRLIHLTLGIL